MDEKYNIPHSFSLKTNGNEFSDLLVELETVLEKINNFELKVYGYDPIEEVESQLDQKQ